MILESATWRASAAWGDRIGYNSSDLDKMNRRAIGILHEVQKEYKSDIDPIFISGCIGSREDGYDPAGLMDEEQAERYHTHQIQVLSDAGADMITAHTMTNTAESIGIVNAARSACIPAVTSFTVETDGNLPEGTPLKNAVLEVDRAMGNSMRRKNSMTVILTSSATNTQNSNTC